LQVIEPNLGSNRKWSGSFQTVVDHRLDDRVAPCTAAQHRTPPLHAPAPPPRRAAAALPQL
jgi:hypothetical protein